MSQLTTQWSAITAEGVAAAIEAHTAGSILWISVSTQVLREAKERGVELADRLRAAVDEFTRHAVTQSNLRISATELGRIMIEGDQARIQEEFERRLPIAVGARNWMQPPRGLDIFLFPNLTRILEPVFNPLDAAASITTKPNQVELPGLPPLSRHYPPARPSVFRRLAPRPHQVRKTLP